MAMAAATVASGASNPRHSSKVKAGSMPHESEEADDFNPKRGSIRGGWSAMQSFSGRNSTIMSSSKDDQSPEGSRSSTSPGDEQYQYCNYPTPGHQNQHFFPPPLPPLPALPGLAVHAPHEMHQQGYVHHYHGSLGAAHMYNYNGTPGTAGFVQSFAHQSVVRSDNGMSPGASQPATRDYGGSHTGESPTGSEASPLSAKESSIQPPGGTPYLDQPPPLPPVPGGLTVSPNDPRQAPTPAALYHNSPYYSEAPNLDTGSGSSESSSSSTNRPVPARSAFMCFSQVKGKEILEKNEEDGSKTGFVESVAAEWRGLSREDRAYWEDVAKSEKARFAREKQEYKGPLTRKLRAKKNPLAPKRPMSAFLMYAQKWRRPLQRKNPDMPNADISRLLGENWHNASATEKRPFLEREEVERKLYKAKMEAWKNNEKLAKSLKSRGAVTAVSASKEQDERRDVTSLSQEEAVSARDTILPKPPRRFRGHAPVVNMVDNPGDLAGTPSYYHQCNFNASNWTPDHYPEDSGGYIQYTYPRPREDEYK